MKSLSARNPVMFRKFYNTGYIFKKRVVIMIHEAVSINVRRPGKLSEGFFVKEAVGGFRGSNCSRGCYSKLDCYTFPDKVSVGTTLEQLELPEPDTLQSKSFPYEFYRDLTVW